MPDLTTIVLIAGLMGFGGFAFGYGVREFITRSRNGLGPPQLAASSASISSNRSCYCGTLFDRALVPKPLSSFEIFGVAI
jgi:hypothetical protein